MNEMFNSLSQLFHEQVHRQLQNLFAVDSFERSGAYSAYSSSLEQSTIMSALAS